jgi:hypothetical protein
MEEKKKGHIYVSTGSTLGAVSSSLEKQQPQLCFFQVLVTGSSRHPPHR